MYNRTLLIAVLLAFTGISVYAQKGSLSCRENGSYNDRLAGNCEIREQTLALSGPIAIDGRQNGGIAIAEVNGRIEFTALNGGVVLKKVGGTVHGSTTNGGLVIELNGDHWDGDTLDVSTTNGGVVMSVPENYSAHLETGTVNG